MTPIEQWIKVGLPKNTATALFRIGIDRGPAGEKDANDYRADPALVKKMLRNAVRVVAQ